MIRRRWRGGWLLAQVLVLAACAGPGGPAPAATATRGAELAHLTQVAGTTEAIVHNVATPRAPTPTPTFGPPSSIPARPGTATIAPTPQGGPNAPTITAIPLVANDLIYDPRSQRIYATIPGRAGAQGNSLVAIDPFTGAIGTPIPIGSEPHRLALSGSGRYLYAALGGTEAIRRYDIARGVVDLDITLDGGPGGGACFASDIEVHPNQAAIIAVVQKCKSGGGNIWPAAYNGATRLPNLASPKPEDASSGDMVFCGDGPTLFRENGTQSFRIDATGIATAGRQIFNLSSNGYVRELRCAGDRLYSSGGEIIDTRTGATAGKYAGLDRPALVYPDAGSRRTFFLDFPSSKVPRLAIYDMERFTLLANIDLLDIVKPASNNTVPGHLVRWGDDGIAFLTDDRLVLLRSPLVDRRVPPPTAAPSASNATPHPPSPTATPTLPPLATTNTKVALVTSDIVYDPGTKQIYASVPGIAGPFGNSVIPIDPTTGTLGTPIAVGSEPMKLALADDGKYLYVGLTGAGAVRRIDLTTQRADLQIDIGSDPREGPYHPGDIAVMPGRSNTIAVVLRRGNDYGSGVALFVDGIKRPVMPAYPHATSIDAIEFCDSSTALYGYNTGNTGADFFWMAVDAEGITVTARREETFGAFGDMVCAGGRVYASYGEVLDPVTQRQVGRCPAGGSPLPDSALGRTFYLTKRPSDSAPIVTVCDQRSFMLLGAFQVPKVSISHGLKSLVRWGTDGLAYRGGPGELFIVRSPLVSGQP